MYEERTVRLSDMRTEGRWPEFTKRAAELGIASMLSFQLFVEGDNLGALNLYSQTARAFGDESEHVGLLFASHAAVAMAGAPSATSSWIGLSRPATSSAGPLAS